MILRPATVLVGFLGVERFQPTFFVEIIDSVRDEPFETFLFDPLREILRQEVLLVLIVSDEVGCHGCNLMR